MASSGGVLGVVISLFETVIEWKVLKTMHPYATASWVYGRTLGKIVPAIRQQRCWVHKTANILNDMLKAMQAMVNGDLHYIWRLESHLEAVCDGASPTPNATQGRVSMATVE
jgi:hypothetical protein